MKRLVRTYGPRRRGPITNLVRTRPRIGIRPPPIPYIGRLLRAYYPTQIADYESVATASWTTETLHSRQISYTEGENWQCYTYQHTVGAQGTGTSEVILPPIRWSMDEPSVDGGYFDSSISAGFDAKYYGIHPTLLPVSGDSHFSAGKVPSILGMWVNMAYQGPGFWKALADRIPNATDSLGRTVTTMHLNRVGRARYMRVRINGANASPLIDFEDINDWHDAFYVNGASGYTFGSGAPPSLVFEYGPQGGQKGTIHFANSTDPHPIAWELEFEDGDTIDFDVWYEARMRPAAQGFRDVTRDAIAGTNILAIPRHVVANSARRGDPSLGNAVQLIGTQDTYFHNIKVSENFDPYTETYSFTFSGGNWTPGSGTAGAKLAITGSGWNATITSYYLDWSGKIIGGTNNGKFARILMSWGNEIADILIQVEGRGEVRYRPQNTGDYVTYFGQRFVGGQDTNNEPTGCFDHLGTTIFERYEGRTAWPPIATISAHFPSSITVTHASQ